MRGSAAEVVSLRFGSFRDSVIPCLCLTADLHDLMTGPRIGLPPGRCRVGIAAAAACLLVATPEPGTATSAQVPQFRSGIDLVQLDVSVLDRSGQPVRGLTAEGFTVFEDGVPQRIQAFSEIVVPVPAPQSSPWSARVSPDVATNARSTTIGSSSS